MRERGDILRKSAHVIDVARLRIRLRCAEAAFCAVVPANAASAIFGEVDVVSQEDRESARRDAEIADDGGKLCVKPVDIHQSRSETEGLARFAVLRRRAERVFRGHGRASEMKMRVGVGLHGSPEVRALKGVDILRGADVHTVLCVGGGRIE